MWAPTVMDLTKSGTVCTLYFEKITNLDLNGSEPIIKGGLVPVIIANNGVVTKTTSTDSNWYDYNNSKWANAVILTNDAPTINVGKTIDEEYIESYFVWIPKYSYKLFNVEGNSISPQLIEIEIGGNDTVNSETECIATNKSGDIGTCSNGKWMTHPAFTSLGVTGFWVGKFETGYKGDTAPGNTIGATKVQIKPNVNSWRYISHSSSYNNSFNYKRTLDSHMMKNTEWGAVAYLTNSKYGRPKDTNGIPTEVWINNNNQSVTGCVGNSVSPTEYAGCQNAYNTNIGYHGSTTDNITGIYDMSGGVWDAVMGVFNDIVSSSGFTSIPSGENAKYYNKYLGSDAKTYKILGDATGEVQGWYSDSDDFVNSSTPWGYRGRGFSATSSAGIFSFHSDTGGQNTGPTFRIVLSPSK